MVAAKVVLHCIDGYARLFHPQLRCIQLQDQVLRRVSRLVLGLTVFVHEIVPGGVLFGPAVADLAKELIKGPMNSDGYAGMFTGRQVVCP